MKVSKLVLIVVLAGFAGSVSAQNGARIDWPRYQDMAVDLMQQYLRINTSNPPGNEIEAARFFKQIFDQHGIQNEVFEYKPGRANIIARLKGSGSKRPIILLSHMDALPRKSDHFVTFGANCISAPKTNLTDGIGIDIRRR